MGTPIAAECRITDLALSSKGCAPGFAMRHAFSFSGPSYEGSSG